jgi:hypothetical protein
VEVIMATTSKSRAVNITRTQALIAGVQKHFGTTPTLIDGTTYATADIVTKLQGQVNADHAVIAAKAAWQAAVKEDEDPEVEAFITKLVQVIRIMYASSPAILGDFGVAPPKAHVVSAATRVLATAKAKATRTARHTLGSNQKKGIKGSVTTVTVGSSGSSDESAPAAAPATPAAPLNGSSGSSGTPAAH